MAFAPYDQGYKVQGRFTVDNNVFEYAKNPDMVLSPKAHGGKNVEFPHLIFVGPSGTEVRKSLVLKTAVHVIVDEDENGRWVIERWAIKKHVQYDD